MTDPPKPEWHQHYEAHRQEAFRLSRYVDKLIAIYNRGLKKGERYTRRELRRLGMLEEEALRAHAMANAEMGAAREAWKSRDRSLEEAIYYESDGLHFLATHSSERPDQYFIRARRRPFGPEDVGDGTVDMVAAVMHPGESVECAYVDDPLEGFQRLAESMKAGA